MRVCSGLSLPFAGGTWQGEATEFLETIQHLVFHMATLYYRGNINVESSATGLHQDAAYGQMPDVDEWPWKNNIFVDWLRDPLCAPLRPPSSAPAPAERYPLGLHGALPHPALGGADHGEPGLALSLGVLR